MREVCREPAHSPGPQAEPLPCAAADPGRSRVHTAPLSFLLPSVALSLPVDRSEGSALTGDEIFLSKNTLCSVETCP